MRDRAVEWMALLGSGSSLSDIARVEGISRERVAQVLAARGLRPRGVRGQPRRLPDPLRVLRAIRQPWCRSWSSLPEGSRELVGHLGMFPAVERLFHWRARRHRRARSPSWTRERVVAVFRAYVVEHGRQPVAADDGADKNRPTPCTLPLSRATVQKVFGSWREGLLAAGLEPRRQGRPRCVADSCFTGNG